MNVFCCFKKDKINNNEASSGKQPHENGIQFDDGGVQSIHDGGVYLDGGGVQPGHDGGVQPNDGVVHPSHEGIISIKSEVWINKIINI